MTREANGLNRGADLAPTWFDSVVAVASELLFILLPLVVVTLVAFHKQRPAMEVFSSPEWSFGASILFGQAAVKMISVAASGAIPERASVLSVCAIVVGLVPSLTVLTFVLSDETSTKALRIPQSGSLCLCRDCVCCVRGYCRLRTQALNKRLTAFRHST